VGIRPLAAVRPMTPTPLVRVMPAASAISTAAAVLSVPPSSTVSVLGVPSLKRKRDDDDDDYDVVS
jgi:hypothetical protein